MSFGLRIPTCVGKPTRLHRENGSFPEVHEGSIMKTFIILVFLALVIAAMIWKMRKFQAEALLARRKALESRKKQQKETVAQDVDIIWPVIIRPVSGKNPPGEKSATEELSMTAIEFAPSEGLAVQQGGKKTAAS
jgi:hypothetical protein